ncbi:MAG: transcriptional repressor [Bacteroidota bacterium]
MRTAVKILSNYSLRSTNIRQEILEVFLDESQALSQKNIEDQMKGECDRVTIYRTLSTFMDKGILHRVLDDSGAMKYALCDPSCSHKGAHHHDHVHFKCTDCGLLTCIHEVVFPKVQLPEGYITSEVNVLIQGVCPNCSGKA